MNVIVINGSPRGAMGNTHRIVAPFLDGAAEAGAQTEYVLLADKDIHYCTGELHCLFKHPGKCIWDDDMTTLMPLVGSADLLVLATPVYFEGPTGQLKVFLDRLAPLLNPAAELATGGTGMRLHEGYQIGKTLLISSCGDWGVQMFDRLVDWAAVVAKILGSDFAGALLRPHAPMLDALEQQGTPPLEVYEAARAAGRQLVEDGQIGAEAPAGVSRDLVDFDSYLQGFRERFERVANESRRADA